MTGHTAGAVLFAKDIEIVAAFYENVGAMRRLRTAQDHIVLEADSFQLVVHKIPDHMAGDISIKSPPEIRERTAVKLALRVSNLRHSRDEANRLGGALYDSDREWQYEGSTVCDGHDPEGNVFQLFEPNGR
jgi:predicted enzyme related to lactoylglutathione lyase